MKKKENYTGTERDERKMSGQEYGDLRPENKKQKMTEKLNEKM